MLEERFLGKVKISIRKFEQKDIKNKITWINNPENNQFLHYDLPLEYQKTIKWFEGIKGRADRFDAVIEADNIPVGLIGLLNIDRKNKKAEYYICMGETQYKGKGVAKEASLLLLTYAFETELLNRVYLYTEVENVSAQKLFDNLGFEREGIIKDDLCTSKGFVDRYVFGLRKEKWNQQKVTIRLSNV